MAPHNAQGRMIIRKLIAKISALGSQLDTIILNSVIKKAIVSVEKFQGSDRNLIIASMGLSSIDQLKAEEEFIYDLTRFNVLTSRAKAKVILVCSYNYLNYLPQNQDFMENSFKIRNYVFNYCNKQKKFSDIEIDIKKENFDLYWFEN